MKKAKTILIFPVILVLSMGTATAQATAFSNVTIIDVREGVAVPGMSVIFEDDRITAVGHMEEIEIPDRATTIDGRGKYLIPGLWDMHAHFSSNRVTREIVFPLFIANGITGIRSLSGGCFGSCDYPLAEPVSAIHRWREEIAAGELTGPRFIAAGPITYGPGPGEPSSVEAPATEEHGRALARLHAQHGLNMIKVYDQIPAEAFKGLVEEGKLIGLPVVGHVPWELSSVAAVRAGMRSIEHLYGLIADCSTTAEEQRPVLVAAFRSGEDTNGWVHLFQSLENFSATRCDSVYAELAKHDVWQVPTLVAGGRTASGVGWWSHPAMRYLPREELEYWMTSLAGDAVSIPGGLASLPLLQYRVALVSVDMYRAGVPLLAGSDALTAGVFPGFGLHEELESFVLAGLTPAEALHAATLEPAHYLEETGSFGTIEPGKVADLVLLDANPLEDIRNTQKIRAVVANGRYFDRQALGELLEKAEKAAKE